MGDARGLYLGWDGAHVEPDVTFERDELGLERARRFGNGIDVEWRRDQAGKPTARRTLRRAGLSAAAAAALLIASPAAHADVLDAREYRWRDDDQIAAIVDSVSGERTYDHDARGRLVRERRGEHVVERGVDDVGNVYRGYDGRDRRYARGGRLEEADGVRYEHDEDGQQILRAGPDGEWR